ncbi:MAG: XdhC family protein [Deltaproteobacteria bacterium]|nr:XdhC family protein [Deltaproteobacteria bacterium]
MEFSWKDLTSALENEPGVALCTIIERRGSVPREVGARMLVYKDGSITGTVGGGIGEHEVIQAARQAIADEQSRLLNFSLAGEQGLDSAAICGGHFTVFIGYWSQCEDYALAAAVATSLSGERARHLLELLPPAPAGEKSSAKKGSGKSWRALLDPDGHLPATLDPEATRPEILPKTVEIDKAGPAVKRLHLDEQNYLLSELTLPPQMIIFGGGHLALPLAEMANWCRFAVTVIDDRPEFSSPQRFPNADRVLTAPMEEVLPLYTPGPTTYLVLITREHKHDYLLLKQLLGTEYAYLGMIGSKRRTSQVKQRLIDEGFDPAEIKRLYSPIGLSLGAQTPAEIAISIMAEIIATRHKS